MSDLDCPISSGRSVFKKIQLDEAEIPKRAHPEIWTQSITLSVVVGLLAIFGGAVWPC